MLVDQWIEPSRAPHRQLDACRGTQEEWRLGEGHQFLTRNLCIQHKDHYYWMDEHTHIQSFDHGTYVYAYVNTYIHIFVCDR